MGIPYLNINIQFYHLITIIINNLISPSLILILGKYHMAPGVRRPPREPYVMNPKFLLHGLIFITWRIAHHALAIEQGDANLKIRFFSGKILAFERKSYK